MELLCTICGYENGAAAMENNMEVSQKVKNRITVGSRNSSSGYLKGSKAGSQRYLYAHIHSSVIHNNQKVSANA
jgi:hypothetical protein